MANNNKENKIEKFTKEAIGKTLNQFNKEIGIADLVEVNKNQDRMLNGILSQVNDESTEKTEKSNIITLDNSTDGVVELKEIQGDTNVNVSEIEEDTPITHDIGDKEGNVFSLNEVTQGAISIGEIQGNTMVNCNKDDKKELVLMKDLSTEGYSNVTLTEGVDGGLVDVALEGNTMVNVCDQKDPVAITKSYTVETGNHVALQGEYDGKCRPVVTGNTLWIDNDTGEVLTAFDESKNLRLQSSFEDKVVTQEMVDNGEEEVDNLDKYKVDYVVTGKNLFDINKIIVGEKADGQINRNYSCSQFIKVVPNTTYILKNYDNYRFDGIVQYSRDKVNLKSNISVTASMGKFTTGNSCYYIKVQIYNNTWATFNCNVQLEQGDMATAYEPYKEYTKTLYLNSPLLEGDTIEQQGDNVVHVHRYGKVVLDGGENWYLIKTNDNTIAFGYTKSDIKNVSPLLCDRFNNANIYNGDVECIWCNDMKAIQIQISQSKLTTQDVAGFKQWLQQNPTTVAYQLQTPQYEVISQNDTILCDSYTNGHLDVDSVVPIKKVVFKEPTGIILKYLYPSTNYNIQFNSDNIGKCTIALGGRWTPQNDIVKGINKLTVSTHSSPNRLMFFNGIGFNASNIVVTEATDQDFGYFEGMKSVGECEDLEVVSCNKNLYNLTENNWINYGYFKPDGTLAVWNGYYYTPDYIDISVLRGKQVYIQLTGGDYTKVVMYDKNKNLIKFQETTGSSDIVIDFPENGYYIRLSTGGTSYQSDTNMICEEGDRIYIEHQSNTQTLTHEPLRAVGDIKDKYVLIDGKWYIERNCGVRAYQDGDKDNYITDMINTVYPLSTPQYEPIDYNPFTVYSDVTHISNNSTIPCNMTIKNTGFNCLLKPSTTYTVSSNLGLSIVTTPSTLTEDCLRFYDTDTSTVTTMKNVTILEGDYTTSKPLPSHFSGIESAFEQEYDEEKGKYKVKAKVVGKNLFDGVTRYGYYSNIGVYGNNKTSTCNTNPIRIVANTTYTISNNMNVFIYDNNMNFLQRIGNTTAFTSPSNGYYVNISWQNSLGYTNLQIEQGTKATPYEPYKENYIEFYISEPLRGIGDVKDKVYVKDDKVVVQRNCGGAIFDGSDDENWIMMNSNTNPIRFDIEHPNISRTPLSREVIKSNTFNYGRDENCITNHSTLSKFILFINKNKLSTQDVAGFKQYLQQNPTTVVYQLAEPTYEEVEYSSNRLILDTFNNESFNNSTLLLNTNISPKISLKPLFEELTYVKSNTKYYIQFNAVGSGEVVISLGGTELTTEIVEGYNCIPITTPSESTNLMTISGQGITINEVVVSEVICGGYYKGLQSCFEEHMENGKYRILLRGIALDGSKVNGIKLYINEPLRGIEDIKDRLCIKNGKLMVERNYGSVTLDGSNYIPRATYTGTNGKVRWIIYSDSSVKNVSSSQITTINNRYPNVSASDTWLNKEGVSQNNDDNIIHLYLEKYSDGSNTSKQSLISELQQNSVTIVYQLVEPVYEEATNEYGLPIVFEGYENGIVYIDSAVTPTTHIKYTSNNQLATTLAEAEEQNIATQEDINMNVITYMMDIDMMLTDMEMSNDISVMAVRRDSSNENMLDRMSEEDKKVYRDNTVVMLEKMITANVLEKEDIEGRIDMYYNKNRISKEQYKYLKSLL